MKLLICGDTVPTAASAPLFAAGDTEGLFSDALEVFKRNDRVVLNLECALTEAENGIRKCGPNLKGPIRTARTLRDAGVTDCAIANNHILDFGVSGMRDTEKALEDAGLGWFGCGENADDAAKPYFIEQNGIKIAILTFNEHEYTYALDDQPGAAPFEPFGAMTRIVEAKKQADYVIVLYHGGKEQCEYPSPRLRNACRAMAKLGADAVFCQHSHIIGCMEKVGGSTIVYGQGNFHFVKYLDKAYWNMGLMAEITLGSGMSVEFIPVCAGESGISLAQGDAAKEILDGFEARSARMLDGTWIDGWREFVKNNAEPYINCIKNAYAPGNEWGLEILAHYMDCEAHLDMLQEIYQTLHKRREDGSMEA